MNDDFSWVRDVAATRYKAPIHRHQMRSTASTLPSTLLEGILPLPWVALIMCLGTGGKIRVLLQQHYMLDHAEKCRKAVQSALLDYGTVVEFTDCETEAELVNELCEACAPVRPVPQPRPTPMQRRSA